MGKWLHEAINILDLIFKNNPNIIHTYSYVPTNPISSHYLVTSLSPLSSNTIPTTCEKDSEYIVDTLNLFSEYTKWANIKESLVKVNWATALHGLTSVEMTKNSITTDNTLSKPTQKRETLQISQNTKDY